MVPQRQLGLAQRRVRGRAAAASTAASERPAAGRTAAAATAASERPAATTSATAAAERTAAGCAAAATAATERTAATTAAASAAKRTTWRGRRWRGGYAKVTLVLVVADASGLPSGGVVEQRHRSNGVGDRPSALSGAPARFLLEPAQDRRQAAR